MPFYDRSDLIDRAIDTLERALLEEIDPRLAGARHLPAALPLDPDRHAAPAARGADRLHHHELLGVTSNIMSLAGIAIAIGVLVDAGHRGDENAFRHLEQRDVDPRDRGGVGGDRARLHASWSAGPIFFSLAIIVLAFVPVFTLTGQEGKLFHPLAFTKTFSMAGATLIAVTLVPVLCTLLARRQDPRRRAPTRSCARCMRLYRPVLRWALRHRVLPSRSRSCSFAGALCAGARGSGSEFMPPAERGRPDVHADHRSSISLPQAIAIVKQQNETIKAFPEVDIGRGEGRAGRIPPPIRRRST